MVENGAVMFNIKNRTLQNYLRIRLLVSIIFVWTFRSNGIKLFRKDVMNFAVPNRSTRM